MDGYRALLIERGVRVTSQWRKVHEQCADDPRAEACDRVDQLEVFQALATELEKEAAAAKEREREVRLRTERKHREARSRVQGPGSRVQGPGSRVQGPRFRAQGLGSRVQGSNQGLGSRI